MKNGFFKHFLVIGLGTLISMTIGLLTTPIITRLVDPVEYGQLSIFTMYSGIFLMILCVGLDQALVRYFYVIDEKPYKSYILKKCVFLPLVLGVVCSGVMILLKGLGINIFGFSWVELTLFVIYMVLQILNRFSVLIIRLEYHSKKYSLLNILNKILYVLIAIVLLKVVKINGSLSLIIATVAAYFIITMLSIIFEKNIWCTNVSNSYKETTRFSELIKYGFPYIFSLGISTLFQYLDKITLNYYCGYGEVGIYSSASTLVAIFALIQSTFNTMWAPISVEHFEKYPEDKSFFQKGNQWITVIMFMIGILLLAGKDVFVLLLGEKYREASKIIPFLMFNPIMYTISETTVNGIVFMKKSKMQILVASGACITNLIGNILLVPSLGGKGAAISTGISYIVFFSLRTFISNQYYYIDFKLKRFYLLTLLMVGYAFYNTFFDGFVLTIIIAVFEIIAVFVLYREACISLIKYGILVIKKEMKKNS